MQNTHESLPDSGLHEQKPRIPVFHVTRKRLSQAARVNVHRDIHARIVQSPTGLKHSALRQLHARRKRVTLHHSSQRERFLKPALRDSTVGLQPLKPTHRMMDQEDDARSRLSQLLDVRDNLLDPIMLFQRH
jgi:hypothetical protein